jgi:hypothetical protein
MPNKDAPLLNIRETDEAAVPKLASDPATMGDQDGADLAIQNVCGRSARALPFL